jgi:hypothetical protein
MPEKGKYRVRRGARIYGPFTRAQLDQLLTSGRIGDLDLISKDDGPWLAAGQSRAYAGEFEEEREQRVDPRLSAPLSPPTTPLPGNAYSSGPAEPLADGSLPPPLPQRSPPPVPGAGAPSAAAGSGRVLPAPTVGARRVMSWWRQADRRTRYGGLGAFAVLLVAGLALMAWLLLHDRSEADFAFLPDDCEVVAGLNLEAWLASSAYQTLKKQLPQFDQVFAGGAKESTGVELTEIQRITFGGNLTAADNGVMVIRTKKAVTSNDILASKGMENFKETTIGRFVIYEKPGEAFCIPDGRTIIMGSPETLRQVLERNRTATLSAEMAGTLKQVDLGKAMGVAVQLRKDKLKGLLGAGAMPVDMARMLEQVEGVALRVDWTSRIDWRLILSCREAKTAEELRKLIDGGLVAFKKAARLPKEMLKMLDSLQIGTTGARLTLAMQLEPMMLADMVRGLGADGGNAATVQRMLEGFVGGRKN